MTWFDDSKDWICERCCKEQELPELFFSNPVECYSCYERVYKEHAHKISMGRDGELGDAYLCNDCFEKEKEYTLEGE